MPSSLPHAVSMLALLWAEAAVVGGRRWTLPASTLRVRAQVGIKVTEVIVNCSHSSSRQLGQGAV
jgi:hypothetical protein